MNNLESRSMAISFLIHGILVLLMLFADETPQQLDDSFMKSKNRFAQMIVRPDEEKPLKLHGASMLAERAAGSLGKQKAIKASKKSGQGKKRLDANSPIDLQKIEKATENLLSKNNLLGMISKGSKSFGAIITAKGFGGDDADAVGGWRGKVGTSNGTGLGVSGVGSGGGGWSSNSIGVGHINTGGNGKGRGWGRSRFARKRTRTINITTGNPMAFGGLDKEIIRRIINQHRSRFKYCYERELIKNPNLEGKIHVWFRIEATGRVYQSKISQTTMNNDRVEECLAQRVRLLRFPSPKGGGVVDVNYPFIFKANRMVQEI